MGGVANSNKQKSNFAYSTIPTFDSQFQEIIVSLNTNISPSLDKSHGIEMRNLFFKLEFDEKLMCRDQIIQKLFAIFKAILRHWDLEAFVCFLFTFFLFFIHLFFVLFFSKARSYLEKFFQPLI